MEKYISRSIIIFTQILVLGLLSGCMMYGNEKEKVDNQQPSEHNQADETYSIAGTIEYLSFCDETDPYYTIRLKDVDTDFDAGVKLYIFEELVEDELLEGDKISVLLPVNHIIGKSYPPLIPGDVPIKVTVIDRNR